MHAIAFTRDIPRQTDEGYDVNLRTVHWAIAGFPMDDAARTLPRNIGSRLGRDGRQRIKEERPCRLRVDTWDTFSFWT